jgi:Carboxypeptidase regulatory-like domain
MNPKSKWVKPQELVHTLPSNRCGKHKVVPVSHPSWQYQKGENSMITWCGRFAQFVVFVLALALFFTIGVGLASAQSSSARGRLEGDILDARGALVASASVTVRNVSTRESFTQPSDDRGHFLFLYLAPGHYKVSIEKNGFTHLDMDDVLINVGTTTNLHPQLAVGQVETKVTVTADAPLVDTT